ncbi:glycosyltransferase family 4 protein [Candidatus Micrarchaeota archaeon]|nr:glycosyltransferase family 4 protein [Candidatus Micrarchaeota archaeon]
MNICMLNPFFHPYQGGTEKHVLEVSTRLAKRHDVTVLTSRSPGTPNYHEIQGVKIKRVDCVVFQELPYPVPPPYPVSPFFLTELIKEIPKHDAFHFHNRFFYTMLDAVLVKRFGGKKLGWTLHNAALRGVDWATDHVGSAVDTLFGKKLLGACHALAAVSGNTMETTAPKDFRGKQRVIYNGVDVDLFHPRNKEEDIRKRFGIPPKRMLLSIARLQPQKGFRYLLQAYAKIVEDHPDVVLVILGRGPQEMQLRQEAASLGISKDIIFISKKITEAELTQLYAACEFFVLTSVWEPFGMVFCEAMASGKAVIGSTAGGIPEIITPKSGLLVETRNIGDLQNKMDLLLEDDQLRKRFESEGRKRVVKHFTWDLSAKGYEELYKQVFEE